MAFSFSLAKAKANKSQLGSKARADEDAKERDEKNALDKVMAEVEEEHGEKKPILGEEELGSEAAEDIVVPIGSKRHYAGRPKSTKSGPGTLFLFEPDSHGRGPASSGSSRVESHKPEQSVYTNVIAKASNLPPNIDPRRVEELFADFPSLKVVKIEKIPPQGRSTEGRPTATMKVTFDKDAKARDLDNAMNKMNDKKYLGKGYYLHLDRYLGGRIVNTEQQQMPFGARLQATENANGVAPPSDLGGSNRIQPHEEKGGLIVTVNQPPDLATMKLIHQTIESVILGGIEFEAALMQDPRVQEEERFAWLYDQRHPLNRYYRWRLSEIVCGRPRADLFKGQGKWQGPKEPLEDEFADSLSAFDPDYEEPKVDEDEKPLRNLPAEDNYPGRVENGYGTMSPRSRAFLIWLLTSLPMGSLVVEDIAAFPTFAVDHAAHGMDEVISILITNVFQPFQLSTANIKKRQGNVEGEEDSRRRTDLKQVTLNALRIISDVLITTSKESGPSYKYRLAMGTQLVERKVFEYLERLPNQLQLGRMTEKTYRDDVNSILNAWKEGFTFENHILEHFDSAFNGPEREREQKEREKKLAEKRKRPKGNVPQKVIRTLDGANDESAEEEDAMELDNDNDESIEEEDAMEVDDDHDAPITSLDGTNNELAEAAAHGSVRPADVQRQAKQVMVPQTTTEEMLKETSAPDSGAQETPAARARRLRPKAEDMFTSDNE